MDDKNILDIKELSVSIGDTTILDKVSLRIAPNQIVGLVGESGSGKSIIAKTIMGILPNGFDFNATNFSFNNTNLIGYTEKDYQKIRCKDISLIFQDPLSSLNPTTKCGDQIIEAILSSKKNSTKTEAKQQVLKTLEQLQIKNPNTIYDSYPFEISGGQRQRVVIAIALVNKPDLIIADEPTTALDVTVQKEIIQLLQLLKTQFGVSILFISHDLALVAELCDKISVIRKGHIVEENITNEIIQNPQQEYTKKLIACRPTFNTSAYPLATVDTDGGTEVLLKNNYSNTNTPLLKITNLQKVYGEKKWYLPAPFEALKEINFSIYQGETFGIVGESGCGKSTLSKCIIGLEKVTNGEIWFEKTPLHSISKSKWNVVRKDIQMIFQDPAASLSPKLNIQNILLEPLSIHFPKVSKSENVKKIQSILQKVNLPLSYLNKYPHELSGGEKQRIGIARAILLEPKLIILDESVAALDVSVQAQILNLLNSLKKEFNYTYLFISHDLSVVKYMSDRVAIIKDGSIEEINTSDEIYNNPQSEYTKSLLSAIPQI